MSEQDKFLVIAGSERQKLDVEDGANVKDILAAANVTRHDGEIFVIGGALVGEDYELQAGETLVVIPPVGLGL